MEQDDVCKQIQRMFAQHGNSLYGGEEVTQLEHALQAATLAEVEGSEPEMIVAALLHDIGHLLHDLPDDSPDLGIDDAHERLAHDWLRDHFGPDVTEPIRLHVDAKRYLCAVDTEYHDSLSPASAQSLILQGGPFSVDQRRTFESHPYFAQCIRLRHWDDLAKIVGWETPNIDHFIEYVRQVLAARTSIEIGS